jgi:hypothetical protein
MGLCLPEQQELNAIGNRLQAEDPRLGSMFGIFTRLTGHEEMPWFERLGMAGRSWRRGIFRRWPQRPAAGWSWAVRAVPFALVAALSILFLALSPNGADSRCGRSPGAYQPARAIAALGHCRARNPAPAQVTPRP